MQIMLKSDEILDFLKQHRQDIEARFSVKRIGLFGSVLRGSASDKSDVDILVELTHPTFDQYMDLKFFLEDKLGRPVDLVLPSADFCDVVRLPHGSLSPESGTRRRPPEVSSTAFTAHLPDLHP
jgi:predicted nucleotidyltransferase